MVAIRYTGDELWERIERAVEKVKDRMARVTRGLAAADVDYAIIGGNAVQLWVAQVDETAVRNTRDVDILLRESDLPRAVEALEGLGFHFYKLAGENMFLDGPKGTPRDAVHIVFSGVKVRDEYNHPAPDVSEYESIKDTRTLALEALVRMKLTSYRRKDQVHVMDMVDVGLIDETWLTRFPDDLRARLKELIDTPDR